MWWNKKKPKYHPLTIAMVEEISGVKLTYPNQIVSGDMEDVKYKELTAFGCSDVWDDGGGWLHRDCFNRNCDNCNYYPVVKEYNEKHNIPNGIETDLIKVFSIPIEWPNDNTPK